MNMSKNKKYITKTQPLFPLSPLAYTLLRTGLPLVLTVALRLLFEVVLRAPFSQATAAHLGAMLEFPVAAVMLLTGAVLLTDALCKRGYIHHS